MKPMILAVLLMSSICASAQANNNLSQFFEGKQTRRKTKVIAKRTWREKSATQMIGTRRNACSGNSIL